MIETMNNPVSIGRKTVQWSTTVGVFLITERADNVELPTTSALSKIESTHTRITSTKGIQRRFTKWNVHSTAVEEKKRKGLTKHRGHSLRWMLAGIF